MTRRLLTIALVLCVSCEHAPDTMEGDSAPGPGALDGQSESLVDGVSDADAPTEVSTPDEPDELSELPT